MGSNPIWGLDFSEPTFLLEQNACFFYFAAHIWLYTFPENTFLQYIVWTLFPLILISFSVGFTYLVSPHAIGKCIN